MSSAPTLGFMLLSISIPIDFRRLFETNNVEVRKTVPRCCVRFLISDINPEGLNASSSIPNYKTTISFLYDLIDLIDP